MRHHHPHTKFFGNVAGYMFGTIHGTMLPTRATAAHLYMSEAALFVGINHIIHKRIGILKEGCNIAFGFQKFYHRLVHTA